MKLEGTVYCSAPQCQSHQHVGADTMALNKLPPGWVVVRQYENNGVEVDEAFCSANCALKWLAQIEPPEVIGGEDA